MNNFWQDLPRPFFVLAPMDGVTDIVFRHVVAKAAPPDVYFTEFTNAAAFFSEHGRASTDSRLAFATDEQPIVAQIWGTNPEQYAFMAVQLAKRGFARQVLDRLSADWRRDPAYEDLAMLLVLALYRCLQAPRIAEVLDVTKSKMATLGLYPLRLEELVARTVANDPTLLTPGAIPF